MIETNKLEVRTCKRKINCMTMLPALVKVHYINENKRCWSLQQCNDYIIIPVPNNSTMIL